MASVAKICSVGKCGKPHLAKGLCGMHYMRLRGYGTLERTSWGLSYTQTSEYLAWRGMKRRCYNKNFKYYSYYGGRGITVAREWINDSLAFLEYMGKKPSPQHSLDRIDNNGNYEPGNVRWATKSEQLYNRRTLPLYNTSASGMKGVHFSKTTNQWVVTIRTECKQWNIGYLNLLEDAISLRLTAEAMGYK